MERMHARRFCKRGIEAILIISLRPVFKKGGARFKKSLI
jgi:hypothetical protein